MTAQPVAQVKLIDELPDVSRIISRELQLALRPLDVRTVVEAAVDSCRVSAENKQLGLNASLPSSPTRIMGDADRLAQVVSNLLGNAVEFTPAGGRIAIALTVADGKAGLSFTRSEDRARALRAGYTAHVAKPVDPTELVTLATNVTTHASTHAD